MLNHPVNKELDRRILTDTDTPSYFFDESAQEGQRTLIVERWQAISSDGVIQLFLDPFCYLGETERSNCCID